MNPKHGAGEAVPAKHSDTDVAHAMRMLEDQVRELMHMSDIAANSFDRAFDVQSKHEGYLTLRITDHEFDQFSFLLNNVAVRACRLERTFNDANRGEVAR